MARLSYGMNEAPLDDGTKKSIESYTATTQPPGTQTPPTELHVDEKSRRVSNASDSKSPQTSPERSKLPLPETEATQDPTDEDDEQPREHAEGIEMAEMGGPPIRQQSRRLSRRMSRASFAASLGPHGDNDGCDAEKEPKVDEEKQYFARPGGPGVLRERLDDANDPAAFFHPASKDPQRIVWIPKDDLGLGDDQVEGNIAAGVKSSNRNATISKDVSAGFRGS